MKNRTCTFSSSRERVRNRGRCQQGVESLGAPQIADASGNVQVAVNPTTLDDPAGAPHAGGLTLIPGLMVHGEPLRKAPAAQDLSQGAKRQRETLQNGETRALFCSTARVHESVKHSAER